MKRFSRLAALLCLCVVAVPVSAGASAARSTTPAYVALTAGQLGIGDSPSEPLSIGLSYRFRPLTRFAIAPAIGATFAENGARFIYSELRRDFRLTRNWLLTPSFGVGWFDDGEHLRLGSELEFRSGLEITRELPSRYRIGLAIYHLSNGGIAEKNPGTESLVLSLHAPFR